MYEKLKQRIKTHEGFRNYVYLDSLGKKTVGYGHLCLKGEDWDIRKSYSIEELEDCFERDFIMALAGAESLIGTLNIPIKVKEVITEMVFQLGKTGVSKFKKMWKALENKDYEEAAKQMLDSKWHRQTPERARMLSDIVKSVA